VSSVSATGRLQEFDNDQSKDEAMHFARVAAVGSGSLFLAAIEAACVALITLNGFSLALGAGTVVLARWATYLHDVDAVRHTLLALATLGALSNVLVVLNGWWLRRAASARWRYRPLTPVERRRILLTLGSAVITLVIVAAELHEHHMLHGHF
jgi:hypothetical protein